jgi:capsule polysaccharide export protein KpsC/LpsZ
MRMRIGIATSGLWRLRDAVELMTGGTACRLPPRGLGVDAIAGWGHKPTADRARALARVRGIPYIAFEDGFLRSVNPGNSERPLSMVMDRTGIYYDARQPSDLEALIRKRASSPGGDTGGRQAMDLLRTSRLSKYNNSTIQDIKPLGLKATRPDDRVLVVDQTRGDASIEGALADASTFPRMLEAAVSENPGAEVLVRIHPETMMGRKAGHFTPEVLADLAESSPSVARAAGAGLLRLTPEPINPWALLEAASKVYCVSSQLGFEALMAGCEVHAFGIGFYAGWGLTFDRLGYPISRPTVSHEKMIAAIYLDYVRYIAPVNNRLLDLVGVVHEMRSKID